MKESSSAQSQVNQVSVRSTQASSADGMHSSTLVAGEGRKKKAKKTNRLRAGTLALREVRKF